MTNRNIDKATLDRLRVCAREAEAIGRLTDEQLAIGYDRRWFKWCVPDNYDGLALALPEGVQLEEELAWIDGSLGWTVTLCSGANLFVGYLNPAIAAPIFTARDVCFGGSGRATGKAVQEQGGYRISGAWNYATGAPHLTYFTANCLLEHKGEPVLDADGQPMVKSFFFSKDDVTVVENWNTFGLKATASHSFEVENLWVSDAHAFVISPEASTIDHPIYRYPFLQFAEVTLAANTLGMTRHFLDCCDEILQVKSLLHKINKQLQTERQQFYEALDTSWAELVRQGEISVSALATVSAVSRSLVLACCQHVVALYPYCGIMAADAASEINQVFRDIFTATQHSLFRPTV